MSQTIQPNPDQALTTRTSVSAVTSFVFGLMSPVVLCGVLSTVVTSLMAIVLGHIALVKIKRNQGSLFGKWQAITGLVFGYLFLPLSLFLTPGFLTPPTISDNVVAGMQSNSNGLQKAESEFNRSKAIGMGNTPEATDMAKEFSRLLSSAINAAIVQEVEWGEDKKLNDTCRVYCHLNDDSVCFLVKIPGYKDYQKGETREALESFAWASGKNVVSNSRLGENAEMESD